MAKVETTIPKENHKIIIITRSKSNTKNMASKLTYPTLTTTSPNMAKNIMKQESSYDIKMKNYEGKIDKKNLIILRLLRR